MVVRGGFGTNGTEWFFRNISTMHALVVVKIKLEVGLWVMADGRCKTLGFNCKTSH
jgi:hypothetical protein